MKAVHPELDRHWNSFFEPVPEGDGEEMRRREAALFLPGSYSYHWHNRYDKGLPERSWAGVLTRRYQRLAMEKTVCRPPAR